MTLLSYGRIFGDTTERSPLVATTRILFLKQRCPLASENKAAVSRNYQNQYLTTKA